MFWRPLSKVRCYFLRFKKMRCGACKKKEKEKEVAKEVEGRDWRGGGGGGGRWRARASERRERGPQKEGRIQFPHF